MIASLPEIMTSGSRSALACLAREALVSPRTEASITIGQFRRFPADNASTRHRERNSLDSRGPQEWLQSYLVCRLRHGRKICVCVDSWFCSPLNWCCGYLARRSIHAPARASLLRRRAHVVAHNGPRKQSAKSESHYVAVLLSLLRFICFFIAKNHFVTICRARERLPGFG